MRNLIETIDPWLGYAELVQDPGDQKEEFEVDVFDLSRGFYSRRSIRTGLPPARKTAIRKLTGRTVGKPATGI
jgi:hypothetical protein